MSVLGAEDDQDLGIAQRGHGEFPSKVLPQGG